MIDAALRQQLPTGDGQDVASEVTKRIEELGHISPEFPVYDDGKVPSLLASIITDIEARVASGERKYGTRLKTNNGRNATLDAYQEILDFLNYSVQVILEGGDPIWLEVFQKTLKTAVWVKQQLVQQEHVTSATSPNS